MEQREEFLHRPALQDVGLERLRGVGRLALRGILRGIRRLLSEVLLMLPQVEQRRV